jgi:hypothetical protein
MGTHWEPRKNEKKKSSLPPSPPKLKRKYIKAL